MRALVTPQDKFRYLLDQYKANYVAEGDPLETKRFEAACQLLEAMKVDTIGEQVDLKYTLTYAQRLGRPVSYKAALAPLLMVFTRIMGPQEQNRSDAWRSSGFNIQINRRFLSVVVKAWSEMAQSKASDSAIKLKAS